LSVCKRRERELNVRVCFHDKCFDGASSAAIFTRFYRERIHPEAEFLYRGMTHKASHPFEGGVFDGDENVVVDFKYSTSPRLTWWFDHHQSAFLRPEDVEHFRQDHSGKKFYDPNFKSCTKFLATIAAEKFGFDPKPLAELIYSVGVSASPTRSKVSVGTNPWKEPDPEVNLASLSEKYGGGGHARVAAISFGPGDLVRARQVAKEIAAKLRQ